MEHIMGGPKGPSNLSTEARKRGAVATQNSSTNIYTHTNTRYIQGASIKTGISD